MGPWCSETNRQGKKRAQCPVRGNWPWPPVSKAAVTSWEQEEQVVKGTDEVSRGERAGRWPKAWDSSPCAQALTCPFLCTCSVEGGGGAPKHLEESHPSLPAAYLWSPSCLAVFLTVQTPFSSDLQNLEVKLSFLSNMNPQTPTIPFFPASQARSPGLHFPPQCLIQTEILWLLL